ncbi:MAG: hypothetical protein ACJ72X_16805 [Nitrososphaeraceae archaeon]|jgi:hypothetical protein
MSQKQNAKDNKRPYGPDRHYTYNALRIAWRDYYNLSKEQVLDKKIISHHKRLIRKLQDKLRKPITDFVMFEAFGLWFYKLNTELFKEDVNNDLIEKAMIKTITILESRMRLDKKPNMVEELIRRDNAMLKYIAETGLASKSDISPNTPRADEANM